MTGSPVAREDYSTGRIRLAFRPADATFAVTDAAIERDPEYLADISELWKPGNRPRQTVRAFLRRLAEKRELDEDIRLVPRPGTYEATGELDADGTIVLDCQGDDTPPARPVPSAPPPTAGRSGTLGPARARRRSTTCARSTAPAVAESATFCVRRTPALSPCPTYAHGSL